MMKLIISYGSEVSNKWEDLTSVGFKSAQQGRAIYRVDKYSCVLPNSEKIKISASYTESNGGISLAVSQEDSLLVELVTYRNTQHLPDPSLPDPVLGVVTNGGIHLSMMIVLQ